MTASNIMYLKAVYQLSLSEMRVGIADIAALRGVSKASASAGIKRLCAKGLATHALYGDVCLSAAGTAKIRQMILMDDMFRLRIENAQTVQGMGLV